MGIEKLVTARYGCPDGGEAEAGEEEGGEEGEEDEHAGHRARRAARPSGGLSSPAAELLGGSDALRPRLPTPQPHPSRAFTTLLTQHPSSSHWPAAPSSVSNPRRPTNRGVTILPLAF